MQSKEALETERATLQDELHARDMALLQEQAATEAAKQETGAMERSLAAESEQAELRTAQHKEELEQERAAMEAEIDQEREEIEQMYEEERAEKQEKMREVGMARMPAAPATMSRSSTSTLMKVTEGYLALSSSKNGAILLQGPHHDAVKSTTT